MAEFVDPLPSRFRPRFSLPVGIIGALLVLFGALAYTASRTKCATYDESLHVPAAYFHLVHGEFRVNPEHPPLWKYFAALPLLFQPLKASAHPELLRAAVGNLSFQWSWAAELIYRTPGNDGQAILNACRFMMTLVGVALGATLARIAWKLGGPVAAVAAAALFCLDPNFTAHAPLVTNDVAFALAMLATTYAVYRAGQRLTPGRALAIAVICGLAVCTKYSAMLLGPLVLMTLTVRALGRRDWVAFGRTLTTRRRRLGAVLLTCAVAGLVSWAIVWTVYRFRYSAAPDGGPINWDALVELTRANELYARHPGVGTTAAEQWHPSVLVRAVLFSRDHRLLPEGFLYGIMHVYMGALVRPSYLMGQITDTGWWYYFPVAMLFKTPLATLAAWVGAAIVGAATVRQWWHDVDRRWLAVCVAIPVGVYLFTSMRTNLNLGLRHVLPIYPLLFLGSALAAARVWNGLAAKSATIRNPADLLAAAAAGISPPRDAKVVRAVLAILAIGLAAESLPAYPDYIPFFNRAAGGTRGGLRLLGDSNLDWGQDLIGLSDWQRRHPDKKLYFLYFGTADPWFYNIRYTNMPGGYNLGPREEGFTEPGVIAISATHLQGIYLGPLYRNYAWMLRAEPMEVIGGSIYLFEFPYTRPLKPERGAPPVPAAESVRQGQM